MVMRCVVACFLATLVVGTPPPFPVVPPFTASVTEHPQTFDQMPGEPPHKPHFHGGLVKLDLSQGTTAWELFFNTYWWVAPQFEKLVMKQVCISKICTNSGRNGTTGGHGTSSYMETLLTLLVKMPEHAIHVGPRSVFNERCESWSITDPKIGNLSACFAQDGVPRLLIVEPLADAVGRSNVVEWAHNMTFHNISVGPVGPIEQLPVWYDGLNIDNWKSCSVRELEKPFQVLRGINDPEPMGILENRDTFDWTGLGVTLGTPTNIRFSGDKYLELYDVDVVNSLGFWRDCNYKPSLKRNVCQDSPTRTPKLITRSSAEQLTGKPHNGSAQGLCDANSLVGSWFSFPSEGKCMDGEALGVEGCTWKLKSVKVVFMDCMRSFNSSGWARAWELDIQKAPFPNVQAHVRAAVAACPDVRDFMI